jgi:uncharacterized protein YprB with RNaseH-like and TPR domain
MKNIFIDCEWNTLKNSEIFLIGFAYNLSSFGILTGKNINAKELEQILKPVTGYVFVYGPDIGFMEKNLDIDIRKKYNCINLLALVRNELPGLKCYKLYKIEQHFNIIRKSMGYKYDIFRILTDWKTPEGRKKVIKYNQEDVINLIRIFMKLRESGLSYRKVMKYRIH